MIEPYFECPRCGAKSYNPNDLRHGYCGRCHAYTRDTVDTCLWCDEPLHGEVSPTPIGVVRLDGKTEMRFQHTQCALREVIGGIGHLIAHEYWCGAPRHDPDAGLTKRQSALLAFAWVQAVGLPGPEAFDAPPDAEADPPSAGRDLSGFEAEQALDRLASRRDQEPGSA